MRFVKEVCQYCSKCHGFGWNIYDDILWQHGKVICKFGSSVILDTKNDLPEQCPFFLEVLLNSEDV